MNDEENKYIAIIDVGYNPYSVWMHERTEYRI